MGATDKSYTFVDPRALRSSRAHFKSNGVRMGTDMPNYANIAALSAFAAAIATDAYSFTCTNVVSIFSLNRTLTVIRVQLDACFNKTRFIAGHGSHTILTEPKSGSMRE